MNKNYSLPFYDIYRNWIKTARRHNKTWEELKFACRGNLKGLENFLEEQKKTNFWEIGSVDWMEILAREKEAEEETKNLEYISKQAMIYEEGQENDISIPEDGKSAWILYKSHLINQGFQEKTIRSIESTTYRI